MTDLQKQKITEMRAIGIGYGKIAVTLQVPESAVKSFCRRHVNTAATQNKPILALNCCKYCGAELINTPGHRQKSFCSAICQRDFWREHRDLMRHPSFVTTTCPVCGCVFSDYKGHHRKYCSHACYITDRYGKGESNEPERIDLPCDDETVSENARKRADHSRGIRRN